MVIGGNGLLNCSGLLALTGERGGGFLMSVAPHPRAATANGFCFYCENETVVGPLRWGWGNLIS